MKKQVIIVAGGKGERMGTSIPKQFIEIGGKPILMWTIERFYLFEKGMSIILVLPESQQSTWYDLCKKYRFAIEHKIVGGGDTRYQSVKNGLAVIDSPSLVAIHDGVRPFVSAEVIQAAFETAEKNGSAIPVMPLNDSIRYSEDNQTSKAVDRNCYKLVQTPQVFQSDILLESYAQKYNESFTDDASVVESAGNTITLTKGNKENIKITTPFDLCLAEILIKACTI